ncbi:GNAT family N-acetyltransferase, partial [Paraburkholderia tuberum]
ASSIALLRRYDGITFAPRLRAFKTGCADGYSLQGEDRAMFLAEHGSTAVGFITVQVMQPTSPLLQPLTVGRIGSVAVLERLRGRGVGSTLMKLAEEWARKNGANDMRLTVWAFNEQAVDLYQELGYELRAFEMGKQLPIAGDMPVA